MGIIGDPFGPGGRYGESITEAACRIGKGLAWAKGEGVGQDQESMHALEVMPDEVKVRYARVLAAQALVDGRLDPREIEYLYVFMSRIGLSSDARQEVRTSLGMGATRPLDLVGLVEKAISEAGENERGLAVSLIKEMTQVSWADGAVSPEEKESIRAVAEARFGDEAEQVIELADRALAYERALLKGEVTISELEEGGKQLAALSTAVGVPLAAVYISGSVVGLSAAGITSGLATLGIGGILGLSAMVTGIGVVVLAGAMVYLGVRWALGGRERDLRSGEST